MTLVPLALCLASVAGPFGSMYQPGNWSLADGAPRVDYSGDPAEAQLARKPGTLRPETRDTIAGKVSPADNGVGGGRHLSSAAAETTDLRLQMLVAEAGMGRQVDHPAMLHAMDRLAARGGRSVPEGIRRHISEFKRGWKPGRTWIPQLTAACTRPDDFAAHLDWEGVHQHMCIRLVAMVRKHARGKLKDPCKGKPDQWRSRKNPKLQRAARAKGWRRIGCGSSSLHVYWEMR